MTTQCHSRGAGLSPRGFLAVVALVGLMVPGCSHFIDPNVPEPIRPYIEPEYSGDYLLYRPSNYDRRYSWPLVVICHTSFPDSPNRRIRQWTELAESHGFIVVAPKLSGTRRVLSPKAGKQLARQRADERTILATVRHVQAAYHISEDRIFIHGFSGGAYAALYAGLRHPGIFRAIALSQPKFREGYSAIGRGIIDPNQPVLVDYSLTDTITGEHARRCMDWLRSKGVELTEDPSGMNPGSDMNRPVAFFEELIRSVPWIHIRAIPVSAKRPLEIQFKLKCSFKPTTYAWDFGDGTGSKEPEPRHEYAEPHTYRVHVTVGQPERDQQRRTVDLKVPEGVITRRR